MEQFYKRMPNDVEMPSVSDDQQALHMEERAIADIYQARKERHERILRESVPLFIRNRDRICAGGGGSPLSGVNWKCPSGVDQCLERGIRKYGRRKSPHRRRSPYAGT